MNEADSEALWNLVSAWADDPSDETAEAIEAWVDKHQRTAVEDWQEAALTFSADYHTELDKRIDAETRLRYAQAPKPEEEREQKSRFCSKCDHPHNYHGFSGVGCVMPLDRNGLPVRRAGTYKRTCGCEGEDHKTPSNPNGEVRQCDRRNLHEPHEWQADFGAYFDVYCPGNDGSQS